MAATTKADLLSVFDKEYAKLRKIIDPVVQTAAMAKIDDVAIKDIIGHRAHWIDLFLGWYYDGQAEKPVFFPAEGYKWNDLKRYNADLRARQADLGWEGAKTLLDANSSTLRTFIDSLSDKALYGVPMKGANNDWTTGRWAEAAGPSHFRSATKYVRAALKKTNA